MSNHLSAIAIITVTLVGAFGVFAEEPNELALFRVAGYLPD